ncbi:Gmp reductase [Theileria orientalis strain Shintoku]|uniref:GMP reductase n=1 Tax=Theileria orientalis strain Shintoku TaxID=869250 RepID=J4CC67_THEOR|nr:Gmp reductase [Theileria orientalis strain Shintoku]PVC52344.1 Gmp reductase [Theileria orientalis]BAM38862.1 Gmp reductase [Theileria orientalis strain Shintoku]|eukprot:XP_009689163.1 Gmp reductase [Theileria orientalis strain Shintoku]
MFKTYNFDDIMLIPRECVLDSRKEADVSARLGNRSFKIPLMTANMPSVIDENVAIKLASSGYLYSMHRFGIDILAFCKKMVSLGLYVSISVGIKQESYDLLTELKENGIVPDYVSIDIAHGHNPRVKKVIDHIRSLFGDKTFIIAGTVGSPEGLRALEDWGADAVRVGIGQGHVCTTAFKTGFGTRNWQLSAVAECAKVAKKVVICDGGVERSADIAKAIHVGAHWIMSGVLFSGTTDSPGKLVEKNGVKYKAYYGNASQRVKGDYHRIEGMETLVECKTTLAERLLEIEEDLQSAVSYSGGTRLEDIRHVDHVFVKSS